MKQYILGITGRMSTGKSYCSRMLNEIAESSNYRSNIIDLDDERRYILSDAPEYREVRADLAASLDTGLLNTDSSFDRTGLAGLIFNDRNAMQSYRNIMVPAMKKKVQHQIHTGYNTDDLIIIEWAALIEDEMLDLVDYNTLLVTASDQKIHERLEDSDLPYVQICSRLECQLDDPQRIEIIRQEQALRRKGHLYLFDTTAGPQYTDYVHLFNSISQHMR